MEVELTEKELLKVVLEEVLKLNQKLDKFLSEKEEPTPKLDAWDEEIPLKTSSDEVLAICQIRGNEMNIHLSKIFPRNIPPFEAFLINRILERMKHAGVIYEVFESLSSIRDISVKNFDETQKREIMSATRWTLEKMWNKMWNKQGGET